MCGQPGRPGGVQGELCKEAAAAEVATLIQRVASSGSDRSGAAREVGESLAGGVGSEGVMIH